MVKSALSREGRDTALLIVLIRKGTIMRILKGSLFIAAMALAANSTAVAQTASVPTPASPAAVAQPQTSAQIETQRRLDKERTEFKGAYGSRDKTMIAKERTELRAAYGADYRADHPRAAPQSAAQIASERELNVRRADYKKALQTGDKKAIAAAKERLRMGYGADYRADHPRPVAAVPAK